MMRRRERSQKQYSGTAAKRSVSPMPLPTKDGRFFSRPASAKTDRSSVLDCGTTDRTPFCSHRPSNSSRTETLPEFGRDQETFLENSLCPPKLFCLRQERVHRAVLLLIFLFPVRRIGARRADRHRGLWF